MEGLLERLASDPSLPRPWWQSDCTLLYLADSILLMSKFAEGSVDCIFADPPYRLSNNGITCQNGKMVSVNKGEWDRSQGLDEDFQFVVSWLTECRRLLKKDGTIWVSGTNHNIFLVGYAMQRLGFRILNDIVWFKPNAAPNLSRRFFTHSHEIVIWAAKSSSSRHVFNYELMRSLNRGRQMRSVWEIGPPQQGEGWQVERVNIGLDYLKVFPDRAKP